MFERFLNSRWPDNMRIDRDAVVNTKGIPDKSDSEFSFPLIPDNKPSWIISWGLFGAAVFLVGLAPVALFFLRGLLVWIEPLLVSVFLSTGIFLLLFPRKLTSMFLWALCLIACSITFVATSFVSETHLLGIVFAGVALLAFHELFVHSLAIRAAAPTSLADRDKLATFLQTMYQQLSPPAGVSIFVPPIILFLACYVYWTWRDHENGIDGLEASTFTVCVCIALLIFIFAANGIDSFKAMRSAATTLKSFLTYNPKRLIIPTGFHSPVGDISARRRLFFVAVLFAVPVANPLFLVQHGRTDLAQKEQVQNAKWSIWSETNHMRPSEAKEKKSHWLYSLLSRLLGGDERNLDEEQQFGLRVPVSELDPEIVAYLKKEMPQHTVFNGDGTLTFDPEKFERERKELQWQLQAMASGAGKRYAEIERERKINQQKTMFRRLANVQAIFVAVMALWALASGVLPFILVFLLWVSVAGRAMVRLDQLGFTVPTESVYRTESLSALTQRLRESNDEIESDSVLFGVSCADGSPIVVPRDALREHVHFLGATGSGKTALGLCPLIHQLLQFDDCSVIVFDLKGDDDLLHQEIRSSGIPTKHFTSELGKGSYTFNLLMQPFWQKMSVADRADLITTCLGLFYGTDYGRKYYSDTNYSLVEGAIRALPNAKSLKELYEALRKVKLPGQSLRDAGNARAALRRMAQLSSLNQERTFDPSADLDLGSLFESPQAWYLSLPSTVGNSVNPDIARLFCFSLLSAAKHAKKPRKQVYLVIDEFQRITASNLEVLLQLARSLDISVILANQSLADLEKPGTNLLASLTSNTRIRQCFTVSGLDAMNETIMTGGEYMVHQSQIDVSPSPLKQVSRWATLQPSPRLRINDLLHASDSPGCSIFSLRTGAGYAQFGGFPFIARSAYHISKAEYESRRHSHWPTDSPHINHEIHFDDAGEAADGVPKFAKPILGTKDQADLQQLLANLDATSEKEK